MTGPLLWRIQQECRMIQRRSFNLDDAVGYQLEDVVKDIQKTYSHLSVEKIRYLCIEKLMELYDA